MTASSHVRVVARIRSLSQSEGQRGSKSECVSSSSRCSREEPELIQADANDGTGNKRWFELDAVFDQSVRNKRSTSDLGRDGPSVRICFEGTMLPFWPTVKGELERLTPWVRRLP
jgi:hypothetical protein